MQLGQGDSLVRVPCYFDTKELFRGAFNCDLQSCVFNLFGGVINFPFARIVKDGVVCVKDVDDASLLEHTSIDFELEKSNGLNFMYQVFVPYATSLFLAVHVPLDSKDIVARVSTFQDDALGNVHEHLTFHWGLWVS